MPAACKHGRHEDYCDACRADYLSDRLNHAESARDRYREALSATVDVLAKIALEPAFIAEGCPGVQRTRYVVGADVKDDALSGALQAKAVLSELA